MPFWLVALAATCVWGAGLVGLLRQRPRASRLLCGILMTHGAILLLISAATAMNRVDGASMALLALGATPIAYLLALRASHRGTPDDG